MWSKSNGSDSQNGITLSFNLNFDMLEKDNTEEKMFFDRERAHARVSWWFETFIDALNTNVPREIQDELMTEYEDTYLMRIRKPAVECIAFAREVHAWPTPHLGSFLAKYFVLLGILLFSGPWFLLFFILINLESALKIAVWVGIALPIMLLVISMYDVRFTAHTQ